MAVLCAHAALGLEPSKVVTQYVHDVWQTEAGLPQNVVAAVLQTRDGYIWLGTQEGLVRFDGARFVVFDKSNTEHITHNSIQALYEAADDSLWIGTYGGGVTRLKAGVFSSFTTRDGLPHGIVRAICQDRPGAVWFGTNAGLARFEGDKFSVYTAREGLGNDVVRALLCDRAGRLWIGTNGGLARFENGAFTLFTVRDGLPNDGVRALYEDAGGDIWIGTNGGLARRVGEKFVTYGTRDGLSNELVLSILGDRDGNLWIGSNGGGLNRFRDGTLTAYTTKDGLSNDSVLAIHEDREGSLWIGTYGGGLNRLRDGKFLTYSKREGLSHDFVYSICEDAERALWIGTYGGGLDRFKDGAFTTLTTRDGLSSDLAIAVYPDRSGAVWVGTYGGGLNRLHGRRLTKFTTKQGLASDLVFAIFEDHAGTIWVGTEGGVNRFVEGRLVPRTPRAELPTASVRAICEDRDGSLWFGTNGAGLQKLAGEKLTTYARRDGLSDDFIWSLLPDDDGVLWIGTRNGGLNRLKGGTITSLTTKDGLFNDAIFSILDDRHGNLWMTSNKGIFRLGKQELEDRAGRRAALLTQVAYGAADGMRSRECNGGAQPGAWRRTDGTLWFPTLGGIAGLDPANIRINRLAPPVTIEEVLVDDQRVPVDRGGGIRVQPGREKFEFHYTALSFVAPERVKFKYRLQGFDRQWVDAGNRRAAYYTHLSAGDYTFVVTAANDDGVWNEAGSAIGIVVVAPLWETWWFRGTALASLALLVVLAVRFRTRRIEARTLELEGIVAARTQALAEHSRELERANLRIQEADRMKSRFLASMSHELRTPLNSIIGFSDILLTRMASVPPEKTQKFLQNINTSGHYLLGLINNILDLSKIEAGKMEVQVEPVLLPDLVEGIRTVISGMASKRGIEVVTDVPGTLPEAWLDAAKVKQILYNLVSNAVKFSAEGGQVEIAVRELGAAESPLGVETVEIAVADHGVGIRAEDLPLIFEEFRQVGDAGRQALGGTGLGLAIVRKFAELQGGRVTVESTPEVGSTFHVFLPREVTSRVADATNRENVPDSEATGGEGEPGPVLIVDDDAEFRGALARQLESRGYRVLQAGSGEEALELTERVCPGVIALDLVLPNLDGWTVLKTLKANPRLSGVPVVVVSVVDNHELGFALGADDYFLKPLDWPRFVARISDLSAARRDDLEKGLEILVIGDDPGLHSALEAQLTKAGYAVNYARNAGAAVQGARTVRPVAIILDLTIPELNGFEVAALLRQDATIASIPVLVLARAEMSATERERLSGNIDAVLVKGEAARRALVETIRELEQRQSRRAAARN